MEFVLLQQTYVDSKLLLLLGESRFPETKKIRFSERLQLSRELFVLNLLINISQVPRLRRYHSTEIVSSLLDIVSNFYKYKIYRSNQTRYYFVNCNLQFTK